MATSTPRPKRAKPSQKQSPRRANRQTEVTEAASEIFYLKGYRAASIQDVADKVGVLKGSLYYYIDSKEDLLWRIVEDVHEQSSAILGEALALEVSAIERIRIFIARHVEWYLDNVQEVSVFFREWRHLTGERFQIARERRRGYEKVIRDLFAAAQDAGDVSPELDLHYAARYVLAAVNAAPDWYRSTGVDSPAHIAENYADMTVGLLTGTPRRPPARSRVRRKPAV
jgi:TetR/AcrR family transcriptional regulator, cholesterol catabolism regulator